MTDLELNHDVDVVDVETAGSHIGSHKDVSAFFVTVALHDVLALLLADVTVERQEFSVGFVGKVLGLDFGLRKNENFFVSVSLDVVFKNFMLFIFVANDAEVLNAVGDLIGLLADKVDKQGLLHLLSSNLLDVLGHGGTEDHRLSHGHGALQTRDVLVKAHVEHLITFVKNLVATLRQVQAVVLAQVNQAAGRGHNNMRVLSPDLVHYKDGALQNEIKPYFGHQPLQRHHRTRGTT